MQSTSTLLMIRPVRFGFNEQTAGSNAFQNQPNADAAGLQQQALAEFDNFVAVLRLNGLEVIVVDDTLFPHTPDSIFPNNWVSFHDNGDVVLYPMQAENRRLERRDDILNLLKQKFQINHITNLSPFESENLYLEGTGSMVLDRENKIAYACLSPRTSKEVLNAFIEAEQYEAFTFNAVDEHDKPIYHTNVLMCVGCKFVIICFASIKDEAEKAILLSSFANTGKQVIDISFNQMNHFAGNMLEVQNANGEALLVMSAQALESLTDSQVRKLELFTRIVSADISTIETIGGGSARCMLAEVHLPVR